MSNFAYSKTNSNSSNPTSNADYKAGSTKCSIESIGILNPETNAYECEKNEWGFNMSIKFSNQKVVNKIFFPSFLLNTSYDANGKLDFRSHFNNNDFKVNGVFECNTTNMEIAITNYTEKFVSWYTDLLNVYVPNGLSVASNLLRMAEFKSKFYECYGYIAEGVFNAMVEGNPAPEEKEGSKGKYYLLDGDILKKYDEHGYTFLCKAVSFEGEDNEVLAQISEAVNNQMFIFSNMIIAEVISHNTGQTGYTFNTFTTSKDKSYLNPVTNLNSLVASVGSVKVGEGEYVTITPKNESEYPEFTRYYYGGIHGLNKKNMRYFDGEVWRSRLQFVFKKDEFNPFVEGNDLKVTYRGKNNPLLKMERTASSIEDIVNTEVPTEPVTEPTVESNEPVLEVAQTGAAKENKDDIPF